jgi:hypothetical protein
MENKDDIRNAVIGPKKIKILQQKSWKQKKTNNLAMASRSRVRFWFQCFCNQLDPNQNLPEELLYGYKCLYPIIPGSSFQIISMDLHNVPLSNRSP